MKGERILIGVLALALAFSLGSQLTRAQVLGPTPAYQLSGENLPAATVMGDDVSIQGRLTDAGGRPLDGPYYISARIYNVSSGGTPLCSSSTLLPLSVENGLFSAVVSGCVPAYFNGDQLWLGVAVGGDAEMTPRQRLNAVPYAWALRPGSIVKGADSYLWVPGTGILKYNSGDTTVWNAYGPSATIYSGSPSGGTRKIDLPIAIPSVFYGQPTRIAEVWVRYRCSNGSNAYIDYTRLDKGLSASDYVLVASDGNVHKTTIDAGYPLTIDPAQSTLSSTDGPLSLELLLQFANGTDSVWLGGVRLVLRHSY